MVKHIEISVIDLSCFNICRTINRKFILIIAQHSQVSNFLCFCFLFYQKYLFLAHITFSYEARSNILTPNYRNHHPFKRHKRQCRQSRNSLFCFFHLFPFLISLTKDPFFPAAGKLFFSPRNWVYCFTFGQKTVFSFF
jgi:hypothetical protein